MNEPDLHVSTWIIIENSVVWRGEQIPKDYVIYINLKQNKSVYWVHTNAVKLSKHRQIHTNFRIVLFRKKEGRGME